MKQIFVLFVLICILSFIESKSLVSKESDTSSNNKNLKESSSLKVIQTLMDQQKTRNNGDDDEILDTTTTEIVSESLNTFKIYINLKFLNAFNFFIRKRKLYNRLALLIKELDRFVQQLYAVELDNEFKNKFTFRNK